MATTVHAAAAHASVAQQAPIAPANGETFEGLDGAGPAAGVADPDPGRNGAAGLGAPRALQGVGAVLDETWDTAESPNFASALQASELFTFKFSSVNNPTLATAVGGWLKLNIELNSSTIDP